MKTYLLACVLILLIGAPAVLWFLSAPTEVDLAPPPRALGLKNDIAVRAANPHGVRSVTVALEQGSARAGVTRTQESDRLLFWKKNLAPQTSTVSLNLQLKDGWKPGPAKLTVEAVGNDFRGQTASKVYEIQIVLEPPRLTVDGEQHYINQGGAELVTFTVGGSWSEAGVRVGKYSFRSFPLPGGKSENERFCLFAFPWDAPADTVPVVFARNAAGQETTARFWYKLFPKQFRRRTLELPDAFIDKVLAELDSGGTGSRLDRFLRINGAMRRENNATLAALREKTEPRFLWQPPFQQLSNSQVEAQFADVRSYVYEGKKVDEQVHLGFDLSKVRQAPVVASNSGKVALAGPLGIYGNCVVIDHGYGLQSIYAHLSSIGVKEGQSVARGEEIGRSGETGLAGGDHLHFSMQIDGVQVNPVEWWDAHWIRDRIQSKLPATAFAQ